MLKVVFRSCRRGHTPSSACHAGPSDAARRERQRRGSRYKVEYRLSLVARSIGNGRGVFWIRVPGSARTSASFGGGKEGKRRWKLFHREKGPTIERNIIDPSGWTRKHYRYVFGQHWRVKIYDRVQRTCNLCRKFERLCIRHIINEIRDDSIAKAPKISRSC